MEITPIKTTCFIYPIENSLKFLFDKIYNATIYIFDCILPRNPVTKKREIRIIPTFIENAVGNYAYDLLLGRQNTKLPSHKYDEIVHKVGTNLAKNTARYKQLDFEFSVIETNCINAWALPGGKIAINSALLKLCTNPEILKEKEEYKDLTSEDKIAAVLSHECIHSDARHNAKTLEFSLIFPIIIFAINYFLKTQKKEDNNVDLNLNLTKRTCDIWLNSLKLIISKNHELEADKYGMHLMKKANYNPKAALWLQEVFEEIQPTPKNIVKRIFINMTSTHPDCLTRLEENRKTLEEINRKEG